MYYGRFTCKEDVERFFGREIDEEIVYADGYDCCGACADVLLLKDGKLYAQNACACAPEWNPVHVPIEVLITEVKYGDFWTHPNNLREAFENHFHAAIGRGVAYCM